MCFPLLTLEKSKEFLNLRMSCRSRTLPQEGPGLGHFIAQSNGANHSVALNGAVVDDPPPYIDEDSMNGHGRKGVK